MLIEETSHTTVQGLLVPESVAVIGNWRVGEAGHSVFMNLREGRFTGRIALVDPRSDGEPDLYGTRVRSHLMDLPWQPDLVVLALPASDLADAVTDCGRAGVRTVLALGIGIGQPAGPALSAPLADIADRCGIRLIGPESLGVINNDPAVRLNATLLRHPPRRGEHGGIALAVRHETTGVAVLDEIWQRGLSLSALVALGQSAGDPIEELLARWAEDPGTHVIALDLATVGEPDRFEEAARVVAARTPIVGLAPESAAAPDRARFRDEVHVADRLRAAGGIVAGSVEEFLDIAELLTPQPAPSGPRVVLVTNTAESVQTALQEAVRCGAVPARVSEWAAGRLQDMIPGARLHGPVVELVRDAPATEYTTAIRILMDGHDTDTVIAVHETHPALGDPTVARVIAAVDACVGPRPDRYGRPIAPPVTLAAALIGAPPPRCGRLPWYHTAESAARAVALAGSRRIRQAAPRPRG